MEIYKYKMMLDITVYRLLSMRKTSCRSKSVDTNDETFISQTQTQKDDKFRHVTCLPLCLEMKGTT